MTIEFTKNTAAFIGLVNVEEAEALLEWRKEHTRVKIDFAQCDHIHTANLQVLMAAPVTVINWPNNESLKTWLETALLA